MPRFLLNKNQTGGLRMSKETEEMEVSEKSKKGEILDAYYKLLNQIEKTKNVNPREEVKKKEEQKTVERVKDISFEKIINQMGSLKIQISQSLDSLEDRLSSEFRRLTDLQQTLLIEESNLEEVHQIQKNADSLSALLLAQEHYEDEFNKRIAHEEEAFEIEFEEKKFEKQKEIEQFESDLKERESQVNKERKREEEEYQYQLKIKRDQPAHFLSSLE